MYYHWRGLGAYLSLNQRLTKICSNPNRIPPIIPAPIISSGLQSSSDAWTKIHADCISARHPITPFGTAGIHHTCHISRRIAPLSSISALVPGVHSVFAAPGRTSPAIPTHYSALVPILNNFSRQNPVFFDTFRFSCSDFEK